MLRRTLTALLLLSIAIPVILKGGIYLFLFLGFFITTSAWEYLQMFRATKTEPSPLIVVGGTFALILTRTFFPEAAEATLTLLVLAAMTVHLVAYERGRELAATDFVVTVGGFLYLGWVGAYLLDLRNLPDGQWWLLFVLASVWVADSFAYFVGSRFGAHKMTPRLSPKKSWEGYFAGVVTGTLFGAAFAQYGPLSLSVAQGALFGFVLSTFTTLGDLGESLLKRQSGVKDSGTFIPGHGGAFDRIDSLIWAAAIGVFWIRWFLL